MGKTATVNGVLDYMVKDCEHSKESVSLAIKDKDWEYAQMHINRLKGLKFAFEELELYAMDNGHAMLKETARDNAVALGNQLTNLSEWLRRARIAN